MDKLKNAGMALVLAVGLVICGGLIGRGLQKGRESDRYVTVKGLAEREVVAGQGTWKVSFNSMGDSLQEAIRRNLTDRDEVMDFLLQSGFSEEELRPDTPRVNLHSEYNNAKLSYSVSDSVLVISNKVELLNKVSARSAELLKKGVALSGWDKPQYHFTDLGSIKPAMIEEATRDARKAAEKFAQDSSSLVGPVRRASQGYFSFRGEHEGVPESEQLRKIARVVVTIDYLVES